MHNESMNNKYIMLTPAGVYAVVNQEDKGAGYHLLLNILSESTTPLLSVDAIKRWSGLEAGAALNLLAKLQASNLVQPLDTPKTCSSEPLERLLPKLISPLCDGEFALLADPQGFYMARNGFEHGTAEELAAISATLATMYYRHKTLFQSTLGVNSKAWGLVNPAGNSELGFWPLEIGKYRFSLVLAGRPRFNQPAFVELVWALSSRYAKEAH